jgi:lipoic acid synthetase
MIESVRTDSSKTTTPTEGAGSQRRLPPWFKVRRTTDKGYKHVHATLKEEGLHSVCQSASCPNIWECFNEGTATFMILGDICTRACRFCAVNSGRPKPVDTDEPRRLAKAVAKLGLKQVVITSVTRDDLPDGGAAIFAETMRQLRKHDPEVRVEFLIPDMKGKAEDIATIIDSGVHVLAHNVETVGRLSRKIRRGTRHDRSLDVLRFISDYTPRPLVKSGLMVGAGETIDEITELLHQLYATGVDLVTIGQYLRPSRLHMPVERYYLPDEFEQLARIGREIGFGHVESGPLVRSSYRAFDQAKELLAKT